MCWQLREYMPYGLRKYIVRRILPKLPIESKIFDHCADMNFQIEILFEISYLQGTWAREMYTF